MKKLLLLFAVALFVVSCQQETPQGAGTNTKIINLTASPSDWVENLDPNKLNRYYSCHFNMPEINSTVFNDGSVTGYIMIDNAQQPLPSVRHFQNTAGALWTQTIDFDYVVGGVNVYVTNSDFAVDPPGAMNFRMVLMW